MYAVTLNNNQKRTKNKTYFFMFNFSHPEACADGAYGTDARQAAAACRHLAGWQTARFG